MERRKVCRYFERGSCKKDNCPFVHLKQNRKTCTFYMEGNCRKGNNCNFYHPPREEEKLASLKQELHQKIKQKNKKNVKHQEEEEQEVENEEIIHEQVENIEKSEEEKEEVKEIEEKTEQFEIIGQKQKIDKINFLLGLNQHESEQSQEEAEELHQPKQMIQFTKVYLKKFPDYNRTKQMKEHIKLNEERLFKGQNFLDLINKIEDPVEKEYYQIVRKYTNYFELFQGDWFHFTIKMRPLLFEKQMQMHFEFKQDTLDLEIDGRKYPKERAIITILNPSIPKDYKEKFLEYIYRYHKNKSVVDTLKFLQNNFERIYKESHFRLENEFYSKKELEKRLKEQANMDNSTSANNQGKPRRKPKTKKIEQEQNPFVKEIKCQQNQKIDNIFYNYELTVDSILLQNCEYVVVEKLLIYLECVCEQKIMYILDGSQDRNLKLNVKLECKKCRNLMIVGMERQVVQLRKELLGKIGVTSGHLLDLGGLGFKVGCICNNQISKMKMYLPGQRISVSCHNCFHSMQIQYMGLKFYNPTLKIPQVRADHELPGKGACKHMKLTFRWYRYGCCGRCFSCDDCHIMGSIVVHEKLKGISMLCGYCSKEQPVADICVFCHKQLVKGTQKTGHWQGGYGCRDQTTLSRKDNKKYTGMTKKQKKQK